VAGSQKKSQEHPARFRSGKAFLADYLSYKVYKKFTEQFRTARCLWLALIFMLSLFVKKNCCPWRQQSLDKRIPNVVYRATLPKKEAAA